MSNNKIKFLISLKHVPKQVMQLQTTRQPSLKQKKSTNRISRIHLQNQFDLQSGQVLQGDYCFGFCVHQLWLCTRQRQANPSVVTEAQLDDDLCPKA